MEIHIALNVQNATNHLKVLFFSDKVFSLIRNEYLIKFFHEEMILIVGFFSEGFLNRLRFKN